MIDSGHVNWVKVRDLAYFLEHLTDLSGDTGIRLEGSLIVRLDDTVSVEVEYDDEDGYSMSLYN